MITEDVDFTFDDPQGTCPTHGLPLELGPDPYYEELCDDRTDVWMCSECRADSARDI